MLAWPAKGKLAKACFPRPRAERPFAHGNDSQSGDLGCRPDRRHCARYCPGFGCPSVTTFGSTGDRRISAANAQAAMAPHLCAEDPILGVASPGHVTHQAAGPGGSADGAVEYFFDADASGTDERRHRVVSLSTQLAVLGFLGLGPTLAVAVRFRELIEFKGQLPEIH